MKVAYDDNRLLKYLLFARTHNNNNNKRAFQRNLKKKCYNLSKLRFVHRNLSILVYTIKKKRSTPKISRELFLKKICTF